MAVAIVTAATIQLNIIPTSIALGAASVASMLIVLLLTRRRKRPEAAPTSSADMLIVDGSNVMFWKENTPDIQTVQRLVDHLRNKGFKVGVIFDASAGHVLFQRYIDDDEFAKLLKLKTDECFVVPKGTIADAYILQAARDLDAGVVTNDRYRDWVDKFPEVRTPGFLIGGRVQNGAFALNSQIAAPTSSA
ncbi:hypothetical protein [Shimia sp. NS0008-38b]|uniref:NYN domain-containing protein n=1 Tax=Shimia sp. NS0008-38b TaxID=3127653 RepID=UPI0033405382